MRRAWKILGIVAVLVVGLAVAAVAVLKSLDLDEYRGLIAEQVEAATGRALTIGGPVRLEISLTPALAVDGLGFANAAWGSRPDMVRLGRLEAEVELLPLLRGEVRVKRLALAGLDVLIETDAAGRGNWEFGAAKKPAEPGGEILLPEVRHLTLADVDLTYVDRRSGDRRAVRLDAVEARADGLDDPIEVKLAGAYRNARFRASGRFGAARRLIDGGQPFPISLEAEALGALLRVDGVVGQPRELAGLDLRVSVEGGELTATLEAVSDLVPALKGPALPAVGPYSLSARLAGSRDRLAVSDIKIAAGRAEQVRLSATGAIADAVAVKGLDLTIAAEGRDLAALAKAAGLALPPLPPIAVGGRFGDTRDGYSLRGFKAAAGKSDLEGELALSLAGKRPRLDARFASRLIDLKDLLPPAAADPSKPPTAAGGGADRRIFPADPFPLDGLKAADAKVAFHGRRLAFDGVSADDVAFEISLVDGRLEVKPATARIGEGTVNGRLVFDGSAPPAVSLEARLDVAGVNAGQLVRTLGVSDWLTGGRLDAKVDLKGRGASLRELMGDLDGEVVATLGEGRLHNAALDLAGADLLMESIRVLNPLAKREEYTEVSCGVVRLTVKDGVATAANGIAVETKRMNVVGSGTVNLRTERLDLAAKPEPREGIGISLGAVAGIVRLAGPLAEPTVGLDREGAARAAASVGAAVATGGLSLLAEGLLGRATADPAPCQTALGRKGPPAKAAPAPAAAGGTATAPAPAQPKDEGGLGGFLRGLGRSIDETLGGRK